MMAKWATWSGSASDLLRVGADFYGDSHGTGSSGLPKSPRVLAGRLRRAQTSLRALGIEIAFSREGRGGTRIITMVASHAWPSGKTVRTVSNAETFKSESQPHTGPLHPASE
jgi:hypothetical protein